MKYKDLKQLNHEFVTLQTFRFIDEFTVSGILYKKRSGTIYTMEKMLDSDKKAMMIYTTSQDNRKQAKRLGLNDWILFSWSFKKLTLTPQSVKAASQARTAPQVVSEMDDQKRDNIIGDLATIKIVNFGHSSPLKGKVDTGASMSSLHADRWKINREQGKVEFICKQISPNVITMPIQDNQAIQSPDGGTEYRPVISLNIRINDKLMHDVLFNLNDRGQMEHPILIGQNILEKGGFLIDPKINEGKGDIDWDKLQEQVKDVEENKEKSVEEICILLQDSNVSFSDLIRHMRTEIAENIEIQY